MLPLCNIRCTYFTNPSSLDEPSLRSLPIITYNLNITSLCLSRKNWWRSYHGLDHSRGGDRRERCSIGHSISMDWLYPGVFLLGTTPTHSLEPTFIDCHLPSTHFP
ncbi:hypothetical protein EYC80_001224 [Monilinia laxa]|uniref:Uncharacterized protein n=1 Tax=Monilinia laxa TaxID=61186 RepID=A0A5N6K9H6_MONLA|nr:hypothetical protein EYC80_001224 [Monilinia laxa]